MLRYITQLLCGIIKLPFIEDNVYQMPRIMGGYDPCLDDYAKTYYNRPDVQKALHVSDGYLLKNWSICRYDLLAF